QRGRVPGVRARGPAADASVRHPDRRGVLDVDAGGLHRAARGFVDRVPGEAGRAAREARAFARAGGVRGVGGSAGEACTDGRSGFRYTSATATSTPTASFTTSGGRTSRNVQLPSSLR